MSAKVGAEDGDQETVDEVDATEKYGHPKEFDPKFHGPIDKRGCTDIICLLLLVTFIIGWAVVAVIAFKHGDPSILVYPTDSWGQKCGLDPAVQNKSFLYFFDITKCAEIGVVLSGCRTPQVCVDECPDKFWSYTYSTAVKQSEKDAKKMMICKYGVNKDEFSVKELIDKNHCASYILPSKKIAKRCVPKAFDADEVQDIAKYSNRDNTTIAKGIQNVLEFISAKENMEYLFEDLRSTWLVIIALLVIGAVASLIWICLMRCFAGVMVWVSLFGTIGVLGYACYFSVFKYLELKNDESEVTSAMKDVKIEQPNFIDIPDRSQLDAVLKLKKTWLILSIVTGTILGILLFVILVLRSRLAIAVALIKQGARAVSDMTFTLGWPLVPWVIQIFVIAIFLAVGIHLISATEEVWEITANCTCNNGELLEKGKRCFLDAFRKQCSNSTECGQTNACNFAKYQKLANVGWLHVYNFFGLIWLLCFLEDFGDMVLAGSFAGWYWTFNRKKDLATFPVASSLSRTARYHLGTIAFGSLIISIIKFIRFFLEYLDYKLRQYNENPVAKAVMCCLRCCFWCLEKFMKFINRNAYIMCAVYGKNFCTSAKDSFFLLMRNAVRAFVLDKVVDFLLFMGKIVIVGGISILSFYIFSGKYGIVEDQVPELHFYFVPVILIAIGTYFIASLFFSVYSMAVDTLFLCFLEDGERNDGSPEKPYYMPKELMEILGKKNKVDSAKSS